MNRTVKMLSAGLGVIGFVLATMSVSAAVPDPTMIAAASSAADHEAIAKAYDAEASSLEKMAAAHENLARTYGQAGGKPWERAQAKHCETIASELTAAARQERALAAEHRKMAKMAGK
ncbi:MAG: hypothetical protein KGI55_07415 [Gammaproteobacteria bacterium]|nr:hypothetical protein [Gammaproteobacteria bacterium]